MRKLKFNKVSVIVIGLLALTLFIGCRKTQDAGVFEQKGVAEESEYEEIYNEMVEQAHYTGEPPIPVEDVEEFADLRAKYIKALESNDLDLLGDTIVDDYVFMQSALVGPDIWGKKAYLRSRKLLDRVVKIEIEPLRVIKFAGDEWGLEMGREYIAWEDPDGNQYDTLGRYMKVINKLPGEDWKYARTSYVWPVGEENLIPDRSPYYVENEYIPDYFGFGEWEARPTDPELRKELEYYSDEMGVQRMLRDGSSMGVVTGKNRALAEHDERTKGQMGFFREGENLSKEQYLSDREEFARPAFGVFPRDHIVLEYIDKGIIEAHLVEPDIAFYFGKSTEVLPSVYWEDYVRDVVSSEHMYWMKKGGDGVWRILFGNYVAEYPIE